MVKTDTIHEKNNGDGVRARAVVGEGVGDGVGGDRVGGDGAGDGAGVGEGECVRE